MPLKRHEWCDALIGFADQKRVYTKHLKALAQARVQMKLDDEPKFELLGRALVSELSRQGHGPELVRLGLAKVMHDPLGNDGGMPGGDDPLGLLPK